MFDAIVTLYQLIGTLIFLIFPLGMLLGTLWLITKMIKAFVRSVVK